MLKKVLIVMISLMLISSVIFAAGSEESSDTEKELVNVTMMIRDRSSISWDGSDLQDLVAEKFNLNIEMDVIDYSAFADKFAVRFNSGDIPDMANFHGINPELVNEAGDRGLLLNFLDYTDFMPNLNNYLVEYQDDLRYYLSNENKLYFAPLVINYPLGYYGLAVRKDLLDNAGFDINNVEDFDDLYKMFSILQEANDGGPVMGSRYTLGNIMQLGEFMGITGKSVWWNAEKEQWEGTYYRPGMRDFVELMAKMYEEGILHPDFLTMQTKERDQLLYNGGLTAFMDNMAYITHTMNNRASEEMIWSQVIPPKYKGTKFSSPTLPNLLTGQGVIVNAKTKADTEIMQFIDWLYSEEGMLRSQYGVEGTDYIMIGDEQWLSLNGQNINTIPVEYHDQLLSVEEYKERQDQLPFNMYGFYSFTTTWRAFSKPNNPEGTNYYENAYKDYVANGVFRGPNPGTPFSEDQLDEFKQLDDPIKTYGEENITKMILGQISIEDNWADFIDGLKEFDYDRFVDLYNESYKTFDSKKVELK